MKIVIICGYPLNKVFSGSKIYEAKLTSHLSHIKNLELHIITVGKENKQFKKDNLIIHMIKERKNFRILFLLSIIQNVKRKITEIAPDVVHAISTGYHYSLAAVFLRDKYPALLTAYGITAKEIKCYREEYKKIQKTRTYILSPIHIIKEKYILSKISNIVVDSLSIKNLVSKWTNSKIYVVPAGIEYDEIGEIQSHTLLNECVDIFFVNNLRKLKGVDILIKSISIVINSIPNISVRIAGIGPQENELKALVKKLNLENNVKFLGFISGEEKYQYYKTCKLVVVPSRWDCQPAALFDAAASGKPVIASDMSNPGIVEDGRTGFTFKSEDIEDLAEKILILLKDEKLREEMGKAAKEKVRQYDWSEVAERYVEIYKEVLADFYGQKTKNKQTREKIL